MIAIIIISVIVAIVLCVLLFIYMNKKKKEREKQTVFMTSITVKKLRELNEKFPKIDTSYVHKFRETYHVKKRNDIYHFDSDVYFEKSKTMLKNAYTKKIKNQSLFKEYERLFNETKEKAKTPLSIIESTNIPYERYHYIECSYIRSLFKRTNDIEEISYTVQAHYSSPQGRSQLSSNEYLYKEDNIAYDVEFPPISIDYSPYYGDKQKEEEKIETPIIKEVKEEEVKTDEYKEDGYLYKIETDHVYLIAIDSPTEDMVVKSKIQINDQEYKVLLKGSEFIGNKQIKSLTLEEGIQDIPASAFKNCTQLEWISLPTTLKTIGKKAFSGCLKLKEARIPEDVISIGEECFSLCPSLADLYLSSTIKEVGPSIVWYSTKAKIHILSGKEISHFDSEWNVDDNEVIFE